MPTTIKLTTVPKSCFDKNRTHDTEAIKEPFCNTLAHDLHEIEAVLSPTQTRHHIPSDGWEPHLYHGLWLPLITRSQCIPTDALHTIILPRTHLIFLSIASGAARIIGRTNASHQEDLVDTFPTHTTSGTPIASLFTPTGERKWFARLDTSSLKDYLRPGASASPTTSVRQLCEQLSLSPRAHNGIEAMREANAEVPLYLVPWREDLCDAVEFRVFCPPSCWSMSSSSEEDETLPRISAISQYQSGPIWRQHSRASAAQEAQIIADECQAIWQEDIETAGRMVVGSTTALEEFRRTGFGFDVFVLAARPESVGSSVDATGCLVEVQLVELNPFGAMSGLGSCLFHWIRDARALYGLERGVEFRVTVEG